MKFLRLAIISSITAIFIFCGFIFFCIQKAKWKETEVKKSCSNSASHDPSIFVAIAHFDNGFLNYYLLKIVLNYTSEILKFNDDDDDEQIKGKFLYEISKTEIKKKCAEKRMDYFEKVGFYLKLMFNSKLQSNVINIEKLYEIFENVTKKYDENEFNFVVFYPDIDCLRAFFLTCDIDGIIGQAKMERYNFDLDCLKLFTDEVTKGVKSGDLDDNNSVLVNKFRWMSWVTVNRVMAKYNLG